MHVAGWGGKSYKTQPGACESACALAFLGGSFRYISNGSIYGVHRFFATTGAFDGDSAQIVSAAVQQYIRDMGVAPELFAEMTQAGKDRMNYLPENRLKSLGIVNDGLGKTTWTIAPVGNIGLVLKGDRDTVWGYQKIVLGCANAGLVAFAVFDPKGNADAIVNMSAISFNINENAVHLPAGRIVEKPTLNKDGWINLMVYLDNQVVKQMMAAKTIGLITQFSFEAPTFLGIGDLDFTDGSKMLPAFVKSCH